MKEILIKINNDNEFYDNVSGYIIGFKRFSILFRKTYTYDDIVKMKEKYKNKRLFVSLNAPVFNSELDEYKKSLLLLDKIGLDGIIVGDQAALTYKLNTNIIIDFMHLNNSYSSINHYYNNGAIGVILTNDITLEEINNIRNNTNAILLKQVFGYAHLSTSMRKFISNYLEYYNLKKENSEFYEISEDNKLYYKVIEDENFTHILSCKVLNLLKYIGDINCDYYIIDSYLIDKNLKIVIDSFITKDKSKNDVINNLFDCDDGFINKKTIYKVIKNDE